MLIDCWIEDSAKPGHINISSQKDIKMVIKAKDAYVEFHLD